MAREDDGVSRADDGELLGWTAKQGRILSGGGVAEKFYTDFTQSQLPHHHLLAGTTHEAFARWRRGDSFDGSAGCSGFPTAVCGVWNRPLFTGGWEHSSDATELVYNTQTPTLFIDLRIPRLRPPFVARGHTSLKTLTDHELKCFARQHCFSGYSLLGGTVDEPDVTRHHIIDWNFVGKPRSRPNRWRVEMKHPSSQRIHSATTSLSERWLRASGNVWKEWSFAKDGFGQHYYMERWERRGCDGCGSEKNAANNENGGRLLALRTARGTPRDKVILVVGAHFAFARARRLSFSNASQSWTFDEASTEVGSLVGVVDAAIENGDRARAEAFLSLEGGHGLITPANAWLVDAATHPWQEGTACAELVLQDEHGQTAPPTSADARVVAAAERRGGLAKSVDWFLEATVHLAGDQWDIVECSFQSAEALETFLRVSQARSTSSMIQLPKGQHTSRL